MNSKRVFVASALIAVMIAGANLAQIVAAGQETANSQWLEVKRQTLAIGYKNDDSTAINMVGSSIAPRAMGKAEVKHKNGRTRIKLEMSNLGNPQALGPYYTTFVLWAITPEGQADNLAELHVKTKTAIDVTTDFKTFGLIITAEPHSAVKLPSSVIVAENALRRGTEGSIKTSSIEYSGDPGTFYAASSTSEPSLNADYNTPLFILGARQAVEIARRAGARSHAETELREAEVKLAALEQSWPWHRKDQEKYSGAAHDVMRVGENARAQAVERGTQARLADERHNAVLTIIQAQGEADRAHYETGKAKANEELTRAEAEPARPDTQVTKQQQGDAQQRLYISLSEILETRREARSLIVNLSDVLFDFNQATLKPGAREKLSRLAAILLAYPGAYRMQVEGHTGAVGSQGYNLKLSEARAEAVRDYLIAAALPADRVVAVLGFGRLRPVPPNDTPEGRQTNRRVEIVISATEK